VTDARADPGRLRVGLVGTGWAAERHARAVEAHPAASLVAIANWREESLARTAERFGVARTTTDWRELADAADVDALVIATPNALHAPQAIAALAAGKSVMVEKPMAASLAEAQQIVEEAERSPGWLMVAHCWRFHPDVRRLRDRVASGRLGEVVKTRGYGVHAGWGPDGWFTQRELAGGGALADMGVHAIDTARFLMGDPTPTRVCAALSTRYGSYQVDDDGILLIGWSNGANSIVECGWWQPHMAGLEADTEVYGTGGYERVWDAPESTTAGDDHCAQEMYDAQMAEFVEAVLAGRQPRPDAHDGAVVMQIVHDAYHSAGVPE
jgi:predicted dehydrogenase